MSKDLYTLELNEKRYKSVKEALAICLMQMWFHLKELNTIFSIFFDLIHQLDFYFLFFSSINSVKGSLPLDI